MTAKNILKELISIRKWSQKKLATEAGLKAQTNVTGILNRGKTMTVENLLLLANTMGCEVVIRDKMGSGTEWIVTSAKTGEA